MLLELAGGGRLDRPVTAVVDPRRKLVDDQRAVGHQEQLDGEDPDEAHPRREAGPQFHRGSLDGRRDPGRDDGPNEDPTIVDVPRDRERDRHAIDGPPDHDRQLGLERLLALEQHRAIAEAQRRRRGSDDRVEIGLVVESDLAPTVVAARGRLQPDRIAELTRGRPDLLR